MSSTLSSVQEYIANAAGGVSPAGNDELVINANESISPATEENETSVSGENSTTEELLAGSDDNPTDSKTQDPNQSNKKSPTSGTKEVITISDDKGRRKIEVDFNNRDQLKQYIQMAHGARKWQAERDQAIQARKAVDSELLEVKTSWNQLEQAYQKGPEELFDLLQGRRGSFKEYVGKQIQKAEFLKNASPEEIQALEARERSEQQGREIDRIRKENEEFKKRVEEERDRAELGALESKVNPAFDRYRFADKLGSPDDEHMFDEMLWNTALKRLEPYEQQGVDLSPALIDKHFREVAVALRRRIGVQADKKATRVVEQKKKEATENVQSKVMSGYRGNENAAEARSLINSGNLTGLLKGWNRYGSLFQKK